MKSTFATALGAPVSDDARGDVTRLLDLWTGGDERALEELMPRVERELRRIAERFFRRERSGHTLQPTALVNELYLRLTDQRAVSWKSRAHFYGTAADMMRRLLIDHARSRDAVKRGRGCRPVPLDEITDPAEPARDVDLLALDEALERLARKDERQARVVELRYFAGLTYREVAEVLEVTERTAKRDWHTARLWLHRELEP